MSSISGQHKIHRQYQDISSGSSHIERKIENPNSTDLTAFSSASAVDFARGVTPASVEAAVRAAPSPSIPDKFKGFPSTRSSWACGRECSTTFGNPHQSLKGGLAPFNSFKSNTTTGDDYLAWRKSHASSKKNQAHSTTVPNHNYQQVN